MKTFDVIIIGGGLAGLSTAAHLIEKDKNLKVLIFDALEIGQGASGVPGGIVNPVTGRRANVLWKAESSMQMLEQRLNMLSPQSETPLHLETGVLRPAIDEELSKNFRRAIKHGRWPKGWIEWLQPDKTAEKHPYLKKTSGALFIPRGKVVQTPAYLQTYQSYLQKQGVTFLTGGPYQLNQEKQWTLDTGTEIFSAPIAVVTAGYKSRENKYWTDLPLSAIKGQVAIYECSRPVDMLPVVSAYGYVAPIDRYRLVVGSTYEHHYQETSPDKQGGDFLDQKLSDLVPDLYAHCKRTDLWSGIRAATPDRRPLAGNHPAHSSLYVLAGLGSKGLLYSEITGKILADHLLSHQKIPKDISLYRFSKYREMREAAREEK